MTRLKRIDSVVQYSDKRKAVLNKLGHLQSYEVLIKKKKKTTSLSMMATLA